MKRWSSGGSRFARIPVGVPSHWLMFRLECGCVTGAIPSTPEAVANGYTGPNNYGRYVAKMCAEGQRLNQRHKELQERVQAGEELPEFRTATRAYIEHGTPPGFASTNPEDPYCAAMRRIDDERPSCGWRERPGDCAPLEIERAF